ncbi:MAG TPA: hypothetical protein PKK96_06170 [Anaerolineales bacterium]|nr:hypothetical protein [Anaerolineales bacterium]HNQ94030.1 hypothetical protein [Anaerolineales bacterium]HNS60572.1 hypothetical protein [Anaerolineales bacterium]
MNPKRIVIDGKAYNSVDEMPEEVRRNYEEAMRNFGAATTNAANPIQALNNIFADANNNGMPDVVENQVMNTMGGVTFVVNGQTYNSLDDLPPEARAKYEQFMGSMDKNRSDAPDYLKAMMNVSQQPSQPAMTAGSYPTADTTRHASRPPLSVSPSIAPDTSNGWMLALAGLFILMICALGAIGVWYFFLR